jgi:hypothetical protein
MKLVQISNEIKCNITEYLDIDAFDLFTYFGPFNITSLCNRRPVQLVQVAYAF